MLNKISKDGHPLTSPATPFIQWDTYPDVVLGKGREGAQCAGVTEKYRDQTDLAEVLARICVKEKERAKRVRAKYHVPLEVSRYLSPPLCSFTGCGKNTVARTPQRYVHLQRRIIWAGLAGLMLDGSKDLNDISYLKRPGRAGKNLFRRSGRPARNQIRIRHARTRPSARLSDRPQTVRIPSRASGSHVDPHNGTEWEQDGMNRA